MPLTLCYTLSPFEDLLSSFPVILLLRVRPSRTQPSRTQPSKISLVSNPENHQALRKGLVPFLFSVYLFIHISMHLLALTSRPCTQAPLLR